MMRGTKGIFSKELPPKGYKFRAFFYDGSGYSDYTRTENNEIIDSDGDSIFEGYTLTDEDLKEWFIGAEYLDWEILDENATL